MEERAQYEPLFNNGINDINDINTRITENSTQNEDIIKEKSSFMIKTIRQWSFFEYMLMIMSGLIVLILTSFLVVRCLITSVPTIYSNSQISKPLVDMRKFEVIKLLNGMDVTLISDVSSSFGSVGLSMTIGAFNDAKYSLYGLGSLVQKIILNGEDYASIDELINKYSGSPLKGSVNALDQSYYWDCSDVGFLISLEYFAKVIKFDITQAELEKRIYYAIDALEIDFNKNAMVSKETSLKNILCDTLGLKMKYYPLGSREAFLNQTFTIEDLSKLVMKYYKDNYIGSNMKIAIQSKLSLKEIRGIIIKLFANIQSNTSTLSNTLKNNKRILNHIPQSPYKLGKLILLNFKNYYSIFRFYFTFTNIPNSSAKYYFKYFEYIFKTKGDNSLSSILQQENAIHGQFINYEHLNDTTLIFTFGYKLTTDGLNNVNNIIYVIFNYIKLLRQSKTNEEIYNDMKEIMMIKFKFREASSNYKEMIEETAHNMILFKDNIAQMQMGIDYVPEYNSTLINAIFDMLIPEKAIIVLSTSNKNNIEVGIAKKMLKDNEIQWKKDQYDQVEYSIGDFTEEQLKTMATYDLYDNKFSFRKKNSYVTKLSDRVYSSSKNEEIFISPKLLINDNHLHLWHKLDRTFNTPRIYGELIINSPFHPINNSDISTFYYTFQEQYLQEAFNIELHEAKEAGSLISVFSSDLSLSIKINTFSDVFEKIIEKIIDLYFNMNAASISEKYIMQLTNQEIEYQCFKNFFQHSNQILKAMLKNQHILFKDLHPPYEYSNIISNIKEKLKHSFFRVIFYGNIEEQKAIEITNKYIKPYLDSKSIYFSQLYQLWDENNLFIYLTEIKDINNIVIFRMRGIKNSQETFIGNYYYLGSSLNFEDHIFFQLFKMTMQQECNKELKTWLNYKFILSFTFSINTNYYFSILALTKGNQDPIEINKKLDEVLLIIEEKFNQIDEENELYKLKVNLIALMTIKDINLNERVETISSKILMNHKDFEHKFEYSIEDINKRFTKKALLMKFNEVFKLHPRKISIQRNYTDTINLESDAFALNKDIPVVVTDDIGFLRH